MDERNSKRDREEVVAAFFDSLRTFNYDKAKDLVDKQKELCKSHPAPAVWPLILTALAQLAVAEKSYTSFFYLSPKWFGRRDAKGLYDVVAQDCKKIDEASMQSELCALAHICGQLIPYANLKSEMIEFFSTLHAMTSVKFCDRSDLLIKVKSVLKRQDKFFHPQLESLKTSFICECEVIEKLLEADVAMAQWKFVTSLIKLQEAQTRIMTLMNTTAAATVRDTWKRTFLGMGSTTTPALYTWLKQYKDAIYSKFTLYFYDILCKQAPQCDMKPYMSKCSTDYCSKIVAFHKKTDAHLVALILNSEGIDMEGPGYTHNAASPLKLTGTGAYISIYCYPSECKEVVQETGLSYLSAVDQASIIMLMSSKEKQLNQSDKPVDMYDPKNNCTYLISRIDPTVSLVVIYKSKKTDREKKSMITFLQDISSQLRYTKLFQELRPS